METIDVTPEAMEERIVRFGEAENITEVEYTHDVGAQVVDRGGVDVRALLGAAGVGSSAGERG